MAVGHPGICGGFPDGEIILAGPVRSRLPAVRLKASWIFQNNLLVNQTVYMRSFINNSGGTLSLHGLITAKRIN
jgi:hypothetical protein